MKFSIGSGGYDLLWNGASHKLRSKPKGLKTHSVEPSCNGKWVPSLQGSIFHWTVLILGPAGQSFGDRCFHRSKKKGSGKVMDSSWLESRSRGLKMFMIDGDCEMKGMYFPLYTSKHLRELVSTGVLGNTLELLLENSSPKIPLHVLGKSLPTLLARPAYLQSSNA